MKRYSLLRLLGFSVADAPSDAESDLIGQIPEALSHLPLDRARFIAVLSSLLGRVAYADLAVSAEERAKMRELLVAHGSLSTDEAEVVVKIAEHQTRLFGSTQSYLMTRDFKAMSTREDRIMLLHLLFEVAAADDEISSTEEHEIGKIATEIGLDRDEFLAVQVTYRDKRKVLQQD